MLYVRQAVTQYHTSTEEVERILSNGTVVMETVETRSKSNGKADSVNVLGMYSVLVCTVYWVCTMY